MKICEELRTEKSKNKKPIYFLRLQMLSDGVHPNKKRKQKDLLNHDLSLCAERLNRIVVRKKLT